MLQSPEWSLELRRAPSSRCLLCRRYQLDQNAIRDKFESPLASELEWRCNADTRRWLAEREVSLQPREEENRWESSALKAIANYQSVLDPMHRHFETSPESLELSAFEPPFCAFAAKKQPWAPRGDCWHQKCRAHQIQIWRGTWSGERPYSQDSRQGDRNRSQKE